MHNPEEQSPIGESSEDTTLEIAENQVEQEVQLSPEEQEKN